MASGATSGDKLKAIVYRLSRTQPILKPNHLSHLLLLLSLLSILSGKLYSRIFYWTPGQFALESAARTLPPSMTSLYDGNGGAEQRTFVKNAQAGWKNVQRDTHRHLLMGVTQFEYLSDLRTELIGKARQVLDDYQD